MKIPSLDSLKKLFKVSSLFDKLKKAHGSGFDFKLAIKKFALNFGIVVVAISVASVADFFSISANMDLLFNWLPESVRDGARTLLGPSIAAGLFALKNWASNRKNEIVWVVETEKPVFDGAAPVVKQDAVPVPLSAKPSALGPPAPSGPIVVEKQAGA